MRKVDAAFSALEEISMFARQRGVEILLENIPNELSQRRAPAACSIELTHLESELRLRHRPRQHARRRRSGIRDHEAAHPLPARARQQRQGRPHLFPLLREGGTIDWKRTMELLRSRRGPISAAAGTEGSAGDGASARRDRRRCSIGWKHLRAPMNPEIMPARITIADAGQHVGETVEIAGWLYNLRRSGKIVFPAFCATAPASSSASR